ncbi:unnamed protein product [Caenorhabditis sp. 36 PRJEB53466]|nr:unnamed protein product [Caenorhabditis sp. 36 PRJEB53466]
MSDPERFCEIAMLIQNDTERKGRVFKSSAVVVNRNSSFSEQFVNFLAASSRDTIYNEGNLTDYNCFSVALRSRSSLLLTDHRITPLMLHQLIEKITEIKDGIKDGIKEAAPPSVFTIADRDAIMWTERILQWRYIESVLKLTALSQVTWATEVHVKRRLELIYHGWKMFLCNGGFIRVLLAFDRPDMKKISEKFRTYCTDYLKDIDANWAKTLEVYEMSNEQLEESILKSVGLTKKQVSILDADVSQTSDATHTHKCTSCFLVDQPIYFSSAELLEMHEKLHSGEENCPSCFEDISEFEKPIHRCARHFSLKLDDSLDD